MVSVFGVGPLYVKSFVSLMRATPLRESEAKKWGIGNRFNDYKLLDDYLKNLTVKAKQEIIAKALNTPANPSSEIPKIKSLYLPIIEKGGFPSDKELLPLMKKFEIKDKESLEIGLYYFLFKTTNYGTELKAARK